MANHKPQIAFQFEKRIAEVQKRMGKLSYCTFASFNTDRPIQPIQYPYRGRNISIDVATQRQVLEQAKATCVKYRDEDMDYQGGWIYLQGPPGVGKSHLAAAMLNAFSEAQLADLMNDDSADGVYNVDYISVPELLQYIRDGFNNKTAGKRLDELCTVDFLVMDDIGSEKSSDWADEQLFTIINYRDKHELATILTSNVEYDRLEPRIADRIAGNAELVVMALSSYRRVKP